MDRWLFWLVLMSPCIIGKTAGRPDGQVAVSYESFASSLNLTGSSVGILRDVQMIFTEGQGRVRERQVKASSLFPVLGVSKLFTAVAVLQLVEQRRLALDDRVFGNHGKLYYFRPDRTAHMDPRLLDVTVRDLLYHAGGWDESLGPVYDPMLNAFLVHQDSNIVNISQEMEVFGILNHDDIIRYMVRRPLDYDPGTEHKESNFGYSLLGRIIEEVSDLSYEEYVMQMIFMPAGMWHTRMGPSLSDTKQSRLSPKQRNPSDKGYVPLANNGKRSIFDFIPASILDASLGWHSNIYDLSRFFLALFKSGNSGLLDPETVEALILEPAFTERPQTGLGQGIGFTVNAEGGFWFHTYHPVIGSHAVIYHKGPPIWFSERMSSQKDVSVFFVSVASTPQPDLIQNLSNWVESSTVVTDHFNDNAMLDDLADADAKLRDRNVIVRYHLSEHHLRSYVNALQMAGYLPVWIHGYQQGDHTYFVIISELTKSSTDLDFLLLVGPSKDRLTRKIVEEMHNGYQLTFLQSYRSVSHDDRLCHVAFMRTLDKLRPIEFDISSRPDSYLLAHDEGLRAGFVPSIQSVEADDDDGVVVTYLLTSNSDHRASLKYHDLNLKELERAAKENAERGYTLYYLDTFTSQGGPRFSAVFQNSTHNWMLQANIIPDQLPREVAKWQSMGYVPQLLSAYENLGQLHFIGLWVSVMEHTSLL